MSVPVLSIIIANYNYGRFIETAIMSVVEQDGFDRCELIIVDGGSTDDSVEIIQKYANGLPPNTPLTTNNQPLTTKISWWCSEKDKGQSDAFNKGFAHARGRFLTWLNADDIFMPGAIRAVLDAINIHPQAEWFAGATAYFADDGMIKTATVPLGNAIPRLLRVPSWMRVSGPSSFFSRNLLARAGEIDQSLRYVMDIDLWMRFANLGASLHVIDKYLWGFRVHEESMTSSSITTGSINEKFATERVSIRQRNGINLKREKMQIFSKRLCGVLALGYLKRCGFMQKSKSAFPLVNSY